MTLSVETEMMSQERLPVACFKGDVAKLKSVEKALVALSGGWKKYSPTRKMKNNYLITI